MTNCLQSTAVCSWICENEHHLVTISSRQFVHIKNRLKDQFVMGIGSLLHFQSGTKTFMRGLIQLPTSYYFEETEIFHVAVVVLYPLPSFSCEHKTCHHEHYRAP